MSTTIYICFNHCIGDARCHASKTAFRSHYAHISERGQATYSNFQPRAHMSCWLDNDARYKFLRNSGPVKGQGRRTSTLIITFWSRSKRALLGHPTRELGDFNVARVVMFKGRRLPP